MSELGRISSKDIEESITQEKRIADLPYKDKIYLGKGLVAYLLDQIAEHPFTDAVEHLEALRSENPEIFEGLVKDLKIVAERCIGVAKKLLRKDSPIRLLALPQKLMKAHTYLYVLVRQEDISDVPSQVRYVRLPTSLPGYETRHKPYYGQIRDMVENGGLIYDEEPHTLSRIITPKQFLILDLLCAVKEGANPNFPVPNMPDVHEINQFTGIPKSQIGEMIPLMNNHLKFIGVQISMLKTGPDTNRYFIEQLDK